MDDFATRRPVPGKDMSWHALRPAGAVFHLVLSSTWTAPAALRCCCNWPRTVQSLTADVSVGASLTVFLQPGDYVLRVTPVGGASSSALVHSPSSR